MHRRHDDSLGELDLRWSFLVAALTPILAFAQTHHRVEIIVAASSRVPAIVEVVHRLTSCTRPSWLDMDEAKIVRMISTPVAMRRAIGGQLARVRVMGVWGSKVTGELGAGQRGTGCKSSFSSRRHAVLFRR